MAAKVFMKQEFIDMTSRDDMSDRGASIYVDRDSHDRKRDRKEDPCLEHLKRRDFEVTDYRRDAIIPSTFVLDGMITKDDARKFQEQANRCNGELNVWDVVLESARDYITIRLVGDLHQTLVPPHDIDRWWTLLSLRQVAELVTEYYGPRGELTSIEQTFRDLPFEFCYANESIEDASHVGFIQAVREYLHTNPELTSSQHSALSLIIEQRLPPKSKILEDYLQIKGRDGAPENYIIALRRLKICMSAVRELIKQAASYGSPEDKYVHKYDEVPDVSCNTSVDENFYRNASDSTRNSNDRSSILKGSSFDSSDSLSLGGRQYEFGEFKRESCLLSTEIFDRPQCVEEKEKNYASSTGGEWGMSKGRLDVLPSNDMYRVRDYKDHIITDSSSGSNSGNSSSCGNDKMKRLNDKSDSYSSIISSLINNISNNSNSSHNNTNNNSSSSHNNSNSHSNSSGSGSNNNSNRNSRNISQQQQQHQQIQRNGNGRRPSREIANHTDNRQYPKRKTRRSKRLCGSSTS